MLRRHYQAASISTVVLDLTHIGRTDVLHTRPNNTFSSLLNVKGAFKTSGLCHCVALRSVCISIFGNIFSFGAPNQHRCKRNSAWRSRGRLSHAKFQISLPSVQRVARVPARGEKNSKSPSDKHKYPVPQLALGAMLAVMIKT